MSISRGRKSRHSESPRKDHSGRGLSQKQTTAGQRRFLHKLLTVLSDIVDEKGHFEDSDDRAEADDDIDPEDIDEIKDNKKLAKAENLRTLSRLAEQQTKGVDELERGSKSNSIIKLTRLCERYGRLNFQIRASLNALGGGGHTAKALEVMHLAVERMSNFDGNTPIDIVEVVEIFSSIRKGAKDVMDSFEELRIFNNKFREKVQDLQDQLEYYAVVLDSEYGHLEVRYNMKHHEYLENTIWKPLVKSFEDFIQELENVADKEIAAIRQAQEFTAQRFLNLTTVATFLSSVTATTLQITANGPTSTLTTVMNTLWFISLVFSTASAMYSLLIMTWRQSSVRQADLSLPSFLHMWLRNGPMFALIAAVVTFSVGLCLLAFQVAGQQGHRASFVPTIFAGFHAHPMLVISAWFLFEQWKANHEEYWSEALRKYSKLIKDPAQEAGRQIRSRLEASVYYLKGLILDFVFALFRLFPSINRNKTSTNDSDIEKANSFNAQIHVYPPARPVLLSETSEPVVSEVNNAVHESQEIDSAKPASMSAIPIQSLEPTLDSSSDSNGDEPQYKPFSKLLQFSPDGKFLVYCTSKSDTDDWHAIVYKIGDLSVYRNYTLSAEGGSVQQVIWDVDSIFIRATEKVYVCRTESDVVEFLEQSAASIQCTPTDHKHSGGFACVSVESLKFYDKDCHELHAYVPMPKKKLLDLGFYGAQKIVLLVSGKEKEEILKRFLIVYDIENGTIESQCQVYDDSTSLIVSQKARMVLIHGSETSVQFLDIKTKDDKQSSGALTLDLGSAASLYWDTHSDQELRAPGGAVGFCGKDDGMIIGVSDYEVIILHRHPQRHVFRYSALHIFTTPTRKASTWPPTSFAYNSAAAPYMFAFGSDDGTIKVWSIQTHSSIVSAESSNYETFDVVDRERRELEEGQKTTLGRIATISPVSV